MYNLTFSQMIPVLVESVLGGFYPHLPGKCYSSKRAAKVRDGSMNGIDLGVAGEQFGWCGRGKAITSASRCSSPPRLCPRRTSCA